MTHGNPTVNEVDGCSRSDDVPEMKERSVSMSNSFIRLFLFTAAVFMTGVTSAESPDLSTPSEPIELPMTSKTPPRLNEDSSAADVLRACRSMLPSRPVELKGNIILRNRKGIPQNEYGYTLLMNRAVSPAQLRLAFTPRDATNTLARVAITRPAKGSPVIVRTDAEGCETTPGLGASVMDTDVTWLDLTLDFLWWSDPVYEEERESETVHGQKCAVILIAPPVSIPGLAAVRLWADKKTGCLMQAEQLDETMKPLRRLWGTRVKKFGDRWMANVLEVETIGSGHRTKIIVEEMSER